VEGINISTNIKAKYKITIARNANFSHPLYTQEFENANSKLETKLDEGDYFLKVEDGKASKIVPITFSSKNKIIDNMPEDGELLKLKPGEGLDLKWGARPVKSYKVYVRDTNGKESVYITHTNSLHLDHVAGASLQWKVIPEIMSGKYSGISNSIKNTLEFQGKLDFSKLPAKTKFNTHDEKIFLEWNSRPQEQFLIKLINLKSMNTIFEKRLASNKIWVPVEVNGNNRIEVSSLDYPGVEKAEFSFEVNTPILAWDANMISEIKSPESDEEVNLKYKENIALNKNSTLHLNYKSVAGYTSEKEIKFGSKENIRLNGFGQYCFYVTLNNPVDFYTNSKEFCMKLIQIPVFGPLPKAEDTILVAINRGTLDTFKISVPKIAKATKYIFEIYGDKEGKKLVLSKEEVVPEMYWITKKSGVYFLRYKVLDSKKRESEFSPFSKFIFPISPLEDWE
jgi:hypothetical protein